MKTLSMLTILTLFSAKVILGQNAFDRKSFIDSHRAMVYAPADSVIFDTSGKVELIYGNLIKEVTREGYEHYLLISVVIEKELEREKQTSKWPRR